MPVKNIKLILSHQIKVIFEYSESLKMSRRIQQQTAMGKSREVRYHRRIYLELNKQIFLNNFFLNKLKSKLTTHLNILEEN